MKRSGIRRRNTRGTAHSVSTSCTCASLFLMFYSWDFIYTDVFFLPRSQQHRVLIMCKGIEGHAFVRKLALAYISVHV